MKRSTLCTILLLAAGICLADFGWLRAQVAIDTARGLVGSKVPLVLRDPDGRVGRTGVVHLAALMRLSNPTVFYPERFIAPTGDTIVAATLTALQDSVYRIDLRIVRNPANTAAGDTVITLEGEALAGSDSVCIVMLENTMLNDAPFGPSRGVVITRSIGPPLPYVRFAILEQNYPNPVPHGNSTTFAFRIDKPSDIRFEFYDLLGKSLTVEYLGVLGLGPHTYVYTPPPTLPTGVYLVRLVTNSGTADKAMHVIR